MSRIPWRFLSLMAGVALLAWLIYDFGPKRLAAQMVKVGPAFFLMPAIFVVGMGVRAFGWWALLRHDDRPGFGATIYSRFAATSLNDVLPLMGVGGEPSRLLWLPPERRRAGTPVLILDRVLLIVADAIFVLVAATSAILGLALPSSLESETGLVIGAAIAIALALVLVTFKKGLAGPVMRLVASLGIKSAESRIARAEEMDATVRTVWREQPKRVLAALGFQLASRVLISAEVWIGLALLGVHEGALAALAISAVPVAVSVVFAFIPSQLGVQDAAMALVFVGLGLDPATGVALTLLQRVRQVIVLPVGFFLLSRAPRFGGARRES
ncbi:MAG: lysylphosphatidylglycerol synthase domain-containing protein [Myxococcales bacterium]